MTSREKAKLTSYQLKEVSRLWYTLRKYNRLVESVPIEWEEFNEVFLGK